MKLYISGPMRGLPESNYPAFREAAKVLRAEGWEVLDPSEHFGGRADLPRHKYLAADIVGLLRECDSIVLLEGWEESDGARLETQIGLDNGYLFYLWEVCTFQRVSRTEVAAALAESSVNDEWSDERQDILSRFAVELAKATGDGSKKRQSGEKPPWYKDDKHEAAMYRHLERYEAGEKHDPDHEAHPLVAAAWRCLAIACQESGNVPNA